MVQLAASDVNEYQTSSPSSAANLSATANHLSDVQVPLEGVHSCDPILGDEARNVLEVVVILVIEEVVVGDDSDECLGATLP
jgi:hypothetical protein